MLVVPPRHTNVGWMLLLATVLPVIFAKSEPKSEQQRVAAAHALRDTTCSEGSGKPPPEVLKKLKQGPLQHLKRHSYTYRRKIDFELAHLRRLRALRSTALAFVGSAVVSFLIGAWTFIACLAYEQWYLAVVVGVDIYAS